MQDTYSLVGTSEKSRSALVSATPDQVLETTRGWAKDLGLAEVRSSPASATFSFPRPWLPWAGLEVRVGTFQTEKGETNLVVTASGDVSHPGRAKDLARIAETLADRICSELPRRGVTVVPQILGTQPHNRRRLRLLTRVLGVLYIGLGIVLLPAAAAGVVLFDARALAGFTIAAWVLLLIVACEVVRWRTLGARATFQTIACLGGCLMALVFTLILVFVG
jgi:hypothetical protein